MLLLWSDRERSRKGQWLCFGERWIQEEEVSSAACPGRRKWPKRIKGTTWAAGHWWFGKTVASRRWTGEIFIPKSGAEGGFKQRQGRQGRAKRNGGWEEKERDLGDGEQQENRATDPGYARCVSDNKLKMPAAGQMDGRIR
jgi:hypothetical protein